MNRQIQKWKSEYKIDRVNNDLALHYLLACSVVRYYEHRALFYEEHPRANFNTFEEMIPTYQIIASINPLNESELYSVMSAYANKLQGFPESTVNYLGLWLIGYVQWLRSYRPRIPESDAVVQWRYGTKNAPQELMEKYKVLKLFPEVRSDLSIADKLQIEGMLREFSEVMLEAGMDKMDRLIRSFDTSFLDEMLMEMENHVSIE